MNHCACGCGALVSGKWKRGHIGKSAEGKRKITPWAYGYSDVFVLHEEKKRISTTPHRYKEKRKLEDTYHCDKCGISDWYGQKLILIMDHIDGQKWNDVLENLQLVCPNCSSLLPTHCRGINKMKAIEITNNP